MNLSCGTMRPGKVLEVLEKGRIKVAAPGLFSDQDDLETLPPVYPLLGMHANAFSSVKKDDPVWVLNFSDNDRQLHWIRKDDYNTNIEDFPTTDEEQNVEVIVNREYGDSTWATIYFSNGDGWVIKEDKSVINIRSNGSILLKSSSDKGVIDLYDGGVSIGAEGGANDNAMLYSEWDKWLKNDLCGMLTAFGTALKSNPYTLAAGTALDPLVQQLRNTGMNIKSNYVTLTSN